MKNLWAYRNFLLAASLLSLGSLASGYFNVGLSIGSGYGNYYPSTGYPVYGWGGGGFGYGAIGSACGGGCSAPRPYVSSCGYNPYTPYMSNGYMMPSSPAWAQGGAIPGGVVMGPPMLINNGGIGLNNLNAGFPGMNAGLPPLGLNGGLNGGLPGGLNGGLNGLGGLPAMSALPPPQPMLPPHLAMNPGINSGINGMAGWGPGFASYPMPGMAYTPMSSCNAGYQPMPVYAVPGGPALQGCRNPYGGCYSTGASSGLYRSLAGGGVTIIDMRSRNEWEKNDTGEIVFNAGLGMSSMLTNVYPVAFPRQEPTLIPPSWFNTGSRDPYFFARPSH